MKMDFARWETFEACCLEMSNLGHTPEDADSICKGIGQRIVDGTLYKSKDTMEIVKAGKDIYTYGPASWEVLDPEGDFITTEAQRNFLHKLFNVVPERYRNIMDEHDDFQAGEPLLSFKGPDGKRYHSHVHEKGMMLCTKARPDDGLLRTTEVRKKLLDGTYKSYSIAGRPVRYETKMDKGAKINYHFDIDPHEISYCAQPMNPAVVGKVEVIQKAEAEPKQEIKKPFAGYDNFDDCVAKNKDKEEVEAYCATVMRETEGDQKSEPLKELPHTIGVDWDEIMKKPVPEHASVEDIKKIIRESMND